MLQSEEYLFKGGYLYYVSVDFINSLFTQERRRKVTYYFIIINYSYLEPSRCLIKGYGLSLSDLYQRFIVNLCPVDKYYHV